MNAIAQAPAYDLPARHQPIKKLSWWHESIVDWMITNPSGKLGECSKQLCVTPSWLSKVIHSQMFQELLAVRRMEHGANISTTVIEKVEGITNIALEKLEDRITDEEAPPSFNALKDTVDLGLKAMGYSNRSAGAVIINNPNAPVQVNTVSPELLESARANMKQAGEKIESDKSNGVSPALPAP